MKTLNVVQGSDQWHQARATHFTASEAPAMMGDSKYTSRNDLLKLKATGVAEEVTDAQQYIFDKGHAAEAAARPIAERIIGEELFPVTAESDVLDKLLASFDGIDLMEEACWEHKLYSQSLAEQVRAEDLEPHYYWQLEQQLLVSGADRILFMCSDGTQENMEHMWYRPVTGRAEQLCAGWNQFEDDLVSYEHKEAKPEAVAEKPADLPVLVVDLVGEVRSSNLATVKDVILARIQAVNTDLQTDNDFATAEATVKFFTKGEKQLEEVKNQALAQTSTIDELFKTVDHLKSEMRTKRLLLNKAVKERKEAIRIEIVMGGKQALVNHIASIEAGLGGYRLPVIAADFATAIKGKKTVASLQSAADDELARAKIEANQQAEKIQANLKIFIESADGYDFLFADKQQLVLLGSDHLKAEIKSRIADQKEKERVRAEQERERIRREEEARIRREQEEKSAEEQRKAKTAQTAEVLPAAKAEPIQQPQAETKPVTEAALQKRFIDPGELVRIPRTEYEQLKRESALLAALQGAGVDNWEGYEHALSMIDQAA
ncbi:MAG: YqaJ viral recombinase family protein [Amphritea sp.]